MTPFSGSYAASDVQFLLKPMVIQDTPVPLKERLIQSGQKHYSELLTHEMPPEAAYVQLFHQAMALNQARLAQHCLVLAKRIIATRQQGITLVSLLRAGTPVGVLLKQILSRYFKIEVQHYSISIIRDMGLDNNALQYILQRHPPESLVFVDGWTGKGVIAGQLTASLKAFAARFAISIPPELYVISDLSGSAAVAATTEDYLIPSCLLNATISGLVSRSVYDLHATASDFHGCVYYEQFKAHDLSPYFIEIMLKQIDMLWKNTHSAPRETDFRLDRAELRNISQQFLREIAERYAVTHPNYIKPGIGEATRVLLRRDARVLLLKTKAEAATQHLRWLAASKAIPVAIMPDCPYQAVALIKEIAS
ncbi:MAG: cysteine protease StiP family protein [Methylococcaceae bacterium]|nr:cysteine protease StiP family protein [Methylococcaceae bacterium]